MSNLKIQDIPHLDVATFNPVGGIELSLSDSFGNGSGKYFSYAGFLDFKAKIEPKKGNTDFGYVYGFAAAVGNDSYTSAEGEVSID